MFKSIVFSVIGIFVIRNGVSQALYFPPKTGDVWETVSPGSLGWCVSEIDSLYNFLEAGDTKAFILLKNGKIALEKYFGTFTKDSLWYWASAGKTLTSFTLGIAKAEGYLKLEDTSSKFLGKGWSSLSAEQEAKITVWNHITMTTGLDDAVSNPDCTDKSCLVYKADPGTRWAYHNAPYTIIDKIIAGATGQTLNNYITAKIKSYTGMNGLFFPIGDNNVFLSTARSMARFGLLLQANGVWNSTTILSDTGYLRELKNSSQNLNKSYGYLTWLNGKASYMVPGLQLVIPGMMLPSAPADLYAALGKNGQYINVVPSQGLVLIRMGNEPSQGGGLVPTTFNDNIWKKLNKVICNNTGVYDKMAESFKAFPNPSYGQIQFSSSANIEEIVICDPHGRLVYDQNHGNSIPAGTLKAGIYTVSARINNALHTCIVCVNN